MKEVIEKGKMKGFEIGKNISIHCHLNDPESWFLTIRKFEIFAHRLCSKNCTKEEIARYVSVELHKKLNIVNNLISDVIPFT